MSLPWKLHVGERSWIGEGAWLHKQDHIYIGHDVVISQETFLTTGSHAHRRDMALITRPIPIAERSLRRRVMDRSWITTTWSALRNSHPSRRRMIASTAPPPCPLCVNLGQGTRTVRISVVEGGEKVPTMSTTMTAAPRPGQAVSVEGVPDPQVPEKARRRTYTAKCKPRFGCLS